MDQCSKHDIPPAVKGDLTHRQGHDLAVELKALERAVLTCRRLSLTSLTDSLDEVVDPH
ncbi:MAG TPA: hypothetical protein VGH66_13920 [Acidimicrobiales bacterium]|jgi:hypothetical protein